MPEALHLEQNYHIMYHFYSTGVLLNCIYFLNLEFRI